MKNDFLMKTFKKSEKIIDRIIDDEVIIIPVKDNVADTESIYNLNRTAAKIWKLVDGKKKVADIRDQLLKDMDVTSDILMKDLRDFFSDLKSVDALEET